MTCFDDVRDAQIEGFNLWNADTDTIIAANMQNFTSFCQSSSNLNIEAVANACVEEVEMRLSGPVNVVADIEEMTTYTIFGSQDGNLFGRRLPIGTYTVSTVLDGSYTPKSRVTFTVKQC